jgi:hypothetical protein
VFNVHYSKVVRVSLANINEKILMSHHEKLIAAFEAYKLENEKFQEKEITAHKEALEGKSKAEGMSQDAARHAHMRK